MDAALLVLDCLADCTLASDLRFREDATELNDEAVVGLELAFGGCGKAAMLIVFLTVLSHGVEMPLAAVEAALTAGNDVTPSADVL